MNVRVTMTEDPDPSDIGVGHVPSDMDGVTVDLGDLPLTPVEKAKVAAEIEELDKETSVVNTKPSPVENYEQDTVAKEPLRKLIVELQMEAQRQADRGNYDAEATLLSFKSQLEILVNEGQEEFQRVRADSE